MNRKFIIFIVMFVVLVKLAQAGPPTYSQNSTNSTMNGTNIQHNLRWASTTALSGYIFQFCNGIWNGTNCGGAAGSGNWADSTFTKCKNITIKNAGSSTLTNF
ncbi:MAG: hypothetical protein NT130_03805, partial [Candidatus Micrarchaeota archaeon]|nr:hypothetical protein [Candidatus Micrarchaeota archaeon]